MLWAALQEKLDSVTATAEICFDCDQQQDDGVTDYRVRSKERFARWSRSEPDGIVCERTQRRTIDGGAAHHMRRHLAMTFDHVSREAEALVKEMGGNNCRVCLGLK